MKKVLCIDVGNTSIKAAVVDEGERIEVLRLHRNTLEDQLQKLQTEYDFQAAIGSRVGKLSKDEERIFYGLPGFFFIDPDTSFPIEIKYASKATLGMDRIAAVVGARSICKEGALLVVDCGTCITYDYLTENNEYLGGAISPGISLRFKSLYNETAALPFVQAVKSPELIGNSTITSIQSGVMNGILNEIRGFAASFSKETRQVKVLLTGGDAHFFENELENTIFATPNLVLRGLYYILMHQKP